jgi:hypothetical protein
MPEPQALWLWPRILADVADVAWFPDRADFASWTGTAPIDASCGEHPGTGCPVQASGS